MDKESIVLGCGCEVYGDEVEELKQRFRLLRLLIVSTALSMPLLWDLLPRGWTKYLRKLGAVLVTSMGLKMLIGGLLLLRG